MVRMVCEFHCVTSLSLTKKFGCTELKNYFAVIVEDHDRGNATPSGNERVAGRVSPIVGQRSTAEERGKKILEELEMESLDSDEYRETRAARRSRNMARYLLGRVVTNKMIILW